jgi:hypothetical protein
VVGGCEPLKRGLLCGPRIVVCVLVCIVIVGGIDALIVAVSCSQYFPPGYLKCITKSVIKVNNSMSLGADLHRVSYSSSSLRFRQYGRGDVAIHGSTSFKHFGFLLNCGALNYYCPMKLVNGVMT